ncbi:unnamed protein product [Brassica rapa subsp. narinosa]
MSLRRALSIRSTLTSLRKQLPSYHIITRENNHEEDSFTSQRSYDSFLHHQLPLAPTSGGSAFAFYRYMSSAHGVGSEKIGVVSDIAGVITDSTLQDGSAQAAAVANAVSEVGVAASDSFLPIAALQHCIDMVHSFTGFECSLFYDHAADEAAVGVNPRGNAKQGNGSCYNGRRSKKDEEFV